MCGIVGHVGQTASAPYLLQGLANLEYRGYDSAGVALWNNGFVIEKVVGVVAPLAAVSFPQGATSGIGHTRWATHGVANHKNAHPHTSIDGRLVLVHNGTIENYKELAQEFGLFDSLQSDTDTEVIASVLDRLLTKHGSMILAIQELMNVLHGSYALVIMDALTPGTLYAVKHRSPLLIGIQEYQHVIVSDASALADSFSEFYVLEDFEFAVVTADQAQIYNKLGARIKKSRFIPYQRSTDRSLGVYQHYMQKEIEEQPVVMRRLIQEWQMNDEITAHVKAASRFVIIASGTSYHAGLVGKHLLESMLQIPVDVYLGSEFAYFPPIQVEKSVYIFLSQSGETMDSIRALERLQPSGAVTISLTNAEHSTLARLTNYHVYLHAGVEIAVASTKAYTAQIAVLALMANAVAPSMNARVELANVALAMEDVISRSDVVHQLVISSMNDQRSSFFIGRGIDYALAQEAALKLKEVSYIQAEGFAAAELKHGTIALMETDTPVIAILSDERGSLTRSNILEVQARNARGIIISSEQVAQAGDDFVVASVHPLLQSLVMALPLQYIAYFAALERGHDIDKPRNLAKSVTVE
jgi:glucosamine--fructose-6-phosphate aminotransferase (isomerizing)